MSPLSEGPSRGLSLSCSTTPMFADHVRLCSSAQEQHPPFSLANSFTQHCLGLTNLDLLACLEHGNIPGMKPKAIPAHQLAHKAKACLAAIIAVTSSHGIAHQLPSRCASSCFTYPPDELEDQDKEHRQ